MCSVTLMSFAHSYTHKHIGHDVAHFMLRQLDVTQVIKGDRSDTTNQANLVRRCDR